MRASSPISGHVRVYVFLLVLLIAVVVALTAIVQTNTPRSGVIPRTTHTFPTTTTVTAPPTTTTWYPTSTTTTRTTTTVPTTTTHTTTTVPPTTTHTTTTTQTTTTVPPMTTTTATTTAPPTTTTVPPTTLPSCGTATQIGQTLTGSSIALQDSTLVIGINSAAVAVYVFNGTVWVQSGASITSVSVYSVALDNSTVALVDTNPPGRVRVYRFNGTAWTLYGNLLNTSSVTSTAISLGNYGNSIVVGEPNQQRSSVYDIIGGTTWTLRGTAISPPNEFNSGQSVALSQDDATTVVIGASGRIRVFRWVNPVWIQLGQILNVVSTVVRVGISSSGNTVVIGDSFYNNFNGQFLVYDYDGTNWVQRGTGVTVAGGDYFGTSVSISANGNTVAASAYDGISAYVRIYDWSGASWVLRGVPIVGADVQTASLSPEGSRVAAGLGSGFISSSVNVYCI
jgi:hypothetical protein